MERGRLLVSLPLSAKRAAERKFFKLLASACKLKKNNVTGGSTNEKVTETTHAKALVPPSRPIQFITLLFISHWSQ